MLAAVLLRLFVTLYVCVRVYYAEDLVLIFPLAWGLFVCRGERVLSPRLEEFSFFCFVHCLPIVNPCTGQAITPYRPREAGLRSVLHLMTSFALLCSP